jgi:hypothetical protein
MTLCWLRISTKERRRRGKLSKRFDTTYSPISIIFHKLRGKYSSKDDYRRFQLPYHDRVQVTKHPAVESWVAVNRATVWFDEWSRHTVDNKPSAWAKIAPRFRVLLGVNVTSWAVLVLTNKLRTCERRPWGEASSPTTHRHEWTWVKSRLETLKSYIKGYNN